MIDADGIISSLQSIQDSPDQSTIRGTLVDAARKLPKTPESLDSFRLGFELLIRIEDAMQRRLALLDFVKEIPSSGPYLPFYLEATEAAIAAADEIEEANHRTTELLRIANELPKTKDFETLRVRAWRLVLGLPDKPRYRRVPIEKVAKELPKASDLTFYRRYTLLGIVKQVPKEGPLKGVYREAMALAIEAADIIEEPYYRKYALLFIANELPKDEDYFDLYKKAMAGACRSAFALKDPFAKEHALVDMLQTLPKTPEFFPFLQEIVGEALSFFTVKRWIEDIEVFDVVDFILSAEELGIKESKKRRFSREKYANIVASELDKFALELNDIRFIETLRPYTHAWIRPKSLRDSAKKVVDHLESLRNMFHGSEIERPVFLKEIHPFEKSFQIHKKETVAECVSIDLGATNTVIMRKRGDAQPDFISLPQISKNYDGAFMVPSILSAETDNIGAAVTDENPVVNIKQLLLDGNPKGAEYMERFFRILYRHIKRAASSGGGWFSLASKRPADVLYITVPVGYLDYRNALKEIVENAAKGVKAEFIEEPLAAAVGYQVASDKDKMIMVVDFGGSTLNTMVLRMNMNEAHIVAKPERSQILGGRDIDLWLAGHLAKKAGITGEVPYRLQSAAEEIKIALSTRDAVPFEWEGREVCRVSREEFEEVLDEHDFYRFIDRTVSHVLKRAEKVGVKKERIEAVIITGGSSKIPSFKDKIGGVFPDLKRQNQIFDHSPLSAVGLGAALYGTRDVTDRHLGVACAVRYTTDDKEKTHSYSIVLEKGEILPLEKTFGVTPSRKLSVQNEICLELYEAPESLVTRRWVSEGGIEFLKQELKDTAGAVLNPLKTISLPFKEPLSREVEVTFCVNENGQLTLKYGTLNTILETDVRLQ